MRLLPAVILSAAVASLCTVLAMRAMSGGGTRLQTPDPEARLLALEQAVRATRGQAPSRNVLPQSPIGQDATGPGGDVTFDGDRSIAGSSDALMREYANRFKAENVSTVWAKNTEIAVLEALTSDEARAAGVALPDDVEVRCKSTLCSINASYPDDGQAGDAATILAMDISEALPRSQRRTVYNRDGSVELQVYAMK